jgi:RNA polymerase sigma factor (sigma-70 family)
MSAKYKSPFVLETTDQDCPSDEELAATALAGDKDSLETLVRRHQPWVFNLAVRMLWSRDLAEDATQEILVKAITKLSTFRGLSRFRTWFYRLAVNHLLNMRKTQMEERQMTLTDMGRSLDGTPDLDLPDPNSVPVDLPLIVEETSATCMTAMLMCLDRRQRMAFILGEIFGVSSELGGEVMEISPDNFRQILSRARHDLYQFMHAKCGLVNRANPCRCAKKARGFMAAGYVDASRRQFTANRLAQINEITSNRLAELQDLDRQHAELFRAHGLLESSDLATKLRELVITSNFDV